MKIIAEPLGNDLYKLIELESGSCYAIRWTILSVGGVWDGSSWIMNKSGLNMLAIKIVSDKVKIVG